MLYNGENCRSANKRTIYHWTRCFGLDFSFLFFVFSSTLFSTTNVPMRIKFTSAKFQSEQILNGYVSFRAKSVWYMLCLFTGCYGIHVSGIVYNFDERQKKKADAPNQSFQWLRHAFHYTKESHLWPEIANKSIISGKSFLKNVWDQLWYMS